MGLMDVLFTSKNLRFLDLRIISNDYNCFLGDIYVSSMDKMSWRRIGRFGLMYDTFGRVGTHNMVPFFAQ